jgi:hypothetical protein
MAEADGIPALWFLPTWAQWLIKHWRLVYRLVCVWNYGEEIAGRGQTENLARVLRAHYPREFAELERLRGKGPLFDEKDAYTQKKKQSDACSPRLGEMPGRCSNGETSSSPKRQSSTGV